VKNRNSPPLPLLADREEVNIMGNITVGRYEGLTAAEWQGWLEPEDRSWICFVGSDGKPVFFLDRDPETGAVR
jgi:hypothetical protein